MSGWSLLNHTKTGSFLLITGDEKRENEVDVCVNKANDNFLQKMTTSKNKLRGLDTVNLLKNTKTTGKRTTKVRLCVTEEVVLTYGNRVGEFNKQQSVHSVNASLQNNIKYTYLVRSLREVHPEKNCG